MCNVKTCIRCGEGKEVASFTRLKYRGGKVHEKRVLSTCLECLDEAKRKRDSIEKGSIRNEVQPCLYCGKPTKVNKKKKYCSRECGRYATGQLKEWDNSPRNCKQCGSSFTPRSKSHNYCSHSCQYTYLREHFEHKQHSEKPCIICGTGFIPKFERNTACSKKCSQKQKKQRDQAKIEPVLCVTCHKEWQPTAPIDIKQGRLNKYCSMECRSKSPEWIESLKDRFPVNQEKKWLTSGTKYRPHYPVYIKECRQCQGLFTARFKTTGLCSKECARLDALRVSREKYKADYVPSKITCKECGKHHITQLGEKFKSFCSSLCSTKFIKRIGRHNRRAKMKGVVVESVNPTAVFNRDKWTCKICGIKTPKKLQGTNEPNAPSLDHIIPIAQNGPHTYENVQCACRKCNSYKSDKIIGQMPMFLYSQTA